MVTVRLRSLTENRVAVIEHTESKSPLQNSIGGERGGKSGYALLLSGWRNLELSCFLFRIGGKESVPVYPYFEPFVDQPFDDWHHELGGVVPGQIFTGPKPKE